MDSKTVTSRPIMSRFCIAVLLSSFASGAWAAGKEDAWSPGDLRPRRPAAPSDYPSRDLDRPAARVVVKLHEGTGLRLREGSLAVASRGDREVRRAESLGLDVEKISRDAAFVERLALEAPGRGELRRLFGGDERSLDARRLAAERRSGRELADLNLYHTIELPRGTRYGDVVDLLAALNATPSVEVAYVPAAVSNAGFFENRSQAVGATPDFRSLQGYRLPAPGGVDAEYAWTIPGGRGIGIMIMDVETRLGDPLFPVLHEDLPSIHPYEFVPLGSNPGRDYCDEQHARAVLGELVGEDDGLGVTGLVPDARAGFESFRGPDYGGGSDVSAALMNAADRLQAGDVLLIELQVFAGTPTGPCTPCSGGFCGLAPMEFEMANFDAISMITAEGIVVVEAAGNGRHSLDDRVYGGIFDRSVRDSGAIFVAASDPGQGPGVPACFTNFGSRIDLHSWGYDVVTTGYGDLHGCVDDPPDCGLTPEENCTGGLPAIRRYTQSFSGTSSASPIVTGAAVSLLGVAEANLGRTLTPEEVRDLLVATGSPPAAGAEIGPQPDLRAALDQLLIPNEPPEPEDDFLSTEKDRALMFTTQQVLANDSDPDGDPVLWCGLADGIVTQPAHGMVTFAGFSPPHFLYRYTPDSGFIGRDSFTYCVEDDRGAEATATISVTVFESIFSDDFESADLSAWGSEVTSSGGSISVSAKAAMAGTYGLRADVAGADHRAFAIDPTPHREASYRAAFLLGISGLELPEGNAHSIFAVRDDVAWQTVAGIQIRRASGRVEVTALVARAGGWIRTPWKPVGEQSQLVLEWLGSDRGAGEVRLLIDGLLAGTVTNLDTGALRVDTAHLGVISGVDAGTSGSHFFDQFESGRF